MTAAVKLSGQLILGLGIGLVLYMDPAIGDRLDIPFLKSGCPFGIAVYFFAAMVIIGTSNAVNLTDGLDGLAIGCVTIVAITYAGISYLTGQLCFQRLSAVNLYPASWRIDGFLCGDFRRRVGIPLV